MTLVSVVIPTYNRSERVQCAIESVLGQSHSDLEVIVVDDGSGDNTVQIIEECGRNDPRVRLVVHDERKGAQAARNTGIRAARGNWIAFLDSDDKWLPDSVSSRLQLAQASGLHIVHSDCYIINSGPGKIERLGVPTMHGESYTELLRGPGPMFQALLVSKEALTRIGYLDESIVSFQEWDTAIRLAEYYEFSFESKETFIYDCRHPDTISKDWLRTAYGYEQVFTKHRWPILRYLGPKGLAFHYQTAAAFYRQANEKARVHRCLLIAFLLWPFRPRAILRRARRSLRWESSE